MNNLVSEGGTEVVKGRDRNAPCWCKSGKKYKKCHLDRDSQPKENPWAAVDINKQAFKEKKCCAHNVGLGPCHGGVIRAHTVSIGPNLSKIAKDGHVLHFTANIADLNRNGGKLSAKKIGVKEASVFYGFCGNHDRELFSCIENQPFAGQPEQCLAIGYRTLSRELYGKDASEHLRDTLRGADKGLNLFEQVKLQTYLDDIDTGNEAARRELKITHDALTKAMVENKPDVIQSLVFEFEGTLPFMFAGAWSPFTDLYGKVLQVGYAGELLEQVIVSSFAGNTRAMICISWRRIAEAPGMIIAEQINLLPDNEKASACLQLVVKHVENIFFNPGWFQGLSEKQREELNRLAADGVDLMGSVPSTPVQPQLDFQLPMALRTFHV